jgi:hypothetical protein
MRTLTVFLMAIAISQGALAETITHKHHHRVSLATCVPGVVTKPCECHAKELCAPGRYCDSLGGTCY